MIKLHDLIAANQLLVSMGGEDQMGAIAAKSIEQSLDLKNRIERALAYAEQAPSASIHARNMARILDGSITVDDEQNELDEQDLPPNPKRLAVTHSAPESSQEPARSKGKLKPGNGLAGRTTQQRLEIREWIAQNGFDVAPSGRIPQKFLDAYDDFIEATRKQRREARKAEKSGRSELPFPGQLAI